MAVSHHDATLNSGNIEHHISGRNQAGESRIYGHALGIGYQVPVG